MISYYLSFGYETQKKLNNFCYFGEDESEIE